MPERRTPTSRRIGLLTPALGSTNVGDFLIVEAIKRFFDSSTEFQEVSTRERLAPEALATLNSCDVVLLCGTNLYQAKWQPLFDEDDLRRIDVPVVPFGVGSSALRLGETAVGPETSSMIKALHRGCAVGSVRDPHSLATVRGVGVENVLLTACPVLYWAQADALPESIPRPRRRVVLTVRNWLMHRWPDAVDNPVQIRFLERVLHELRGVEVILAIHEEYDRRLLDIVDIGDVEVVDTTSVADYVSMYSDPDNVVVAMRLHAGMLAVANGVPSVFVSHDTRSYSFCDMLGIRDVELFDDDSAERVAAAALAHVRGEPPVSDKRAERFTALTAAMRTFLDENGLS